MWSFLGWKDEKKDVEDKEDYEEQTIKTYTHHSTHPSNNFSPNQEYMGNDFNHYKQGMSPMHTMRPMQSLQPMVYIDPSQYNLNRKNINQGISSDDEDKDLLSLFHLVHIF